MDLGKVSFCFWVKARDRINDSEQRAQTLGLDYRFAAAIIEQEDMREYGVGQL